MPSPLSRSGDKWVNSSESGWHIHMSIHVSKLHSTDVIMGTIASQITSLTIVYSTVYSVADQRKHQSSAPLAFVRWIHRGPVDSPHKWPATRKMFPFDDVIMNTASLQMWCDVLVNWSLRSNFRGIWIKIMWRQFSFSNMPLKCRLRKWRPLCISLNLSNVCLFRCIPLPLMHFKNGYISCLHTAINHLSQYIYTTTRYIFV